MTNKKMLEAALNYAARGWAVFPVHGIRGDGQCSCGVMNCSDAGKHPAVERGLKEASKDPEVIKGWFSIPEPRNVAVVTGKISDLTVLDIDIGPGKMGAETWAELTRDAGEPETLVAQTGSGGMHFFFKYNSALKTSGNTLGKGVDCRNDGGFVVAAPSAHRSGGKYSWVEETTPLGHLPAELAKKKETRGRPRKDDMFRGKYSIEQVRRMLTHIEPDDRDLWRKVGVILGREFSRSDEGWEMYSEWSAKWGGKKGRNHDEIMREAYFEISQLPPDTGKELTIGTIVRQAMEGGWAPLKGEVPIGNFIYYGPGNNFIYRPTMTHWVAAAVDAAVSPVNEEGKIMPASEWLKQHQLATSMTCDPAIDEDYVKGQDCRHGEVVEVPGAAMFNTYRKPSIEPGDARLAGPFLEHVKKVFNKPGDADQFLDYMAHRVQKPWEKPRFALLLAGGQGVGKDTAVEFCAPAIGSWNCANIDPSALESGFNEFAAATLVRISEAANLQEMTKWAFNEKTKVLIAGSPDVVNINPKYGSKFSTKMHCGVIITTNHLASGIYIPADDRRYDVIDAATMHEMGIVEDSVRKQYFSELWDWFLEGGANHVASYLLERDISGWSASNGQRKTAAHKAVVAAGSSGDHWLHDVMDELKWPDFVRSDKIRIIAEQNGENPKDVNRKISNTIGRLGYINYNCNSTRDGRWKIDKKNVTVYAKIGAVPGPDFPNDLGGELF